MRARSIRALRRRRGWTQAELAARLGTDPVTVSRWERGASHPRPSAIVRLREFSSGDADLRALAGEIGTAAAERLLRRAALLERKPTAPSFAASPTIRLREIDRMLREQVDLKTRLGRS